jgi:exopolysaccharide biosynthesis polyprenyl glycosylphosphotransferase
MLALADVIAVLIGVCSMGFVTGSDVERTLWAAVFLPIWIVLAKLYGLYDRDHTALRHLAVDELPSISLWALTGTASMSLLLIAAPTGPPSVHVGIRVWIITAVGALVLRAFARSLWRRITPPERTFILGSGPLADATRRKLDLFPDMHIRAVDDPRYSPEELIQEPRHLVDLALDRIILATHAVNERLIADLVSLCRGSQIKLSLVPPAQGMFGTAARFARVADLSVLDYNTWDVSRSTLFLKRVLDLVGALIGLVVLSPLFVSVAIGVALESRGPVIFSQVRAGYRGRRFRMHKFRTMVADAEHRLPELVSFDALDAPMFKLSRDPRVTRIGRLLRRASLDELPQLVNVLAGDMSLVGPRPEQIELVERYAPEHRFRLEVKPGITGPMQIYGRGNLTFEERLAVERDYIENLSLGRDLRILAMTIMPVISGRGAF